ISPSLATSPSASSASLETEPTIFWNCSLRATKSVSELISTAAPLVPAVTTPTRPSAATRSAFLAALARPRVRSQSTAASMSPLVSARAFLQSIMPTPVSSRSCLTIAAVISMGSPLGSPRRGCIVRLVRPGGPDPGKPRMEDEGRLPFESTAIRNSVDGLLAFGRQVFGRSLAGFTQIGAQRAGGAADAIDGGARDQRHIELEGPAGIVIARNGVVDHIRIAVGIDDGHHGIAQATGFLDRIGFLVGVDDEQQVGKVPHVLDAAQVALQALLLAGHHQAL